jgi:two-component system nitrogen regulation sensor histidine kinase NtrY
LVKNASEAIETDSGVRGEIVTRIRTRAGRVIIEVIDNGKGLPKENRNRLVEPYMTTREKGTGLGLAIVQKITEQHGGRLQLLDAPKRNGRGGGACVRIDFPQTADVAATREPVKARKKTKSMNKTKSSPKRGKSGKRNTAQSGATHGV